jgi:hypothetical protein
MLATLHRHLISTLDWLNGLPAGTQQVVAGIIVALGAAAIAAAGAVLWRILCRIIRPVTSDDWLSQEQRFASISDGLYAISEGRFDSRPFSWRVYPGPPNPKEPRRATLQDVELFRAEAARASRLLMRSWRYLRNPRWWRERDPVDRWLSAAVSLVGPGAVVSPELNFKFSGEDHGTNTEGDTADRLATLSMTACKLMAQGAKPRPAVSASALGPEQASPPSEEPR